MEGDSPCQRNQLVKGISIHALRMEGDMGSMSITGTALCISIHALRMEGDPAHNPVSCPQFRISIHALRMEGDNLYRK